MNSTASWSAEDTVLYVMRTSGQGVGSVGKILPAAELIARFKKEYDEAIDPPL